MVYPLTPAPWHQSIDSGRRKKKGSELEQIDCTPPEHILPGSKERPLMPLQPPNNDWKVRGLFTQDPLTTYTSHLDIGYVITVLTLKIKANGLQ